MKYSRLDRKKNPPDNINSNGIPGLIDGLVKETYRISEEEYNILLSNLSDYEHDLFCDVLYGIDTGYTSRKFILTSIKKYLDNQ